MFAPTDRLFSIGQFARLHEVNKKTLMWYDEIGLLKPAVTKPNGYRYYTYHQSSVLEVILMLRDLDVPISDIQKFLNNRSASTFETLLSENISKIEQRITHLTAMQEILTDKQRDMKNLHRLDLSEIAVIEKKKANRLVTMATSEDPPLMKTPKKSLLWQENTVCTACRTPLTAPCGMWKNCTGANPENATFCIFRCLFPCKRRGCTFSPPEGI